MNTISWVWVVLTALLTLLLVFAAARRFIARRTRRRARFVVDDSAIERILRHGTLSTGDDEPLDEDEIARAEEEFWQESWDEPDEYDR
jgi:flagellar biosynthesis/type III secretory pathway M-ring protein FliF/YscJ